jgi:predicted nucleotidyltransferase
VELLFATGNDLADEIAGGVIGIWESIFPGRIRGYYLFGSYSAGAADSSSDLDIAILFKDRFLGVAETEQAQRLCEWLDALHPAITVDMFYVSEDSVQQPDRVSVALRLKRSSVLLYGQDTRDRITAEPDERYVRDAMHIPYYGSRFGRPDLDELTFPLDYPQPGGEFFGYDGWRLDYQHPRGTKMLVVIVSRIATALVALRAGQYAGSKHESAQLYRTLIGDEWSDLVEQVYECCKRRWGYRVPRGAGDRAHLRELCQRALGFENLFFSLYRAYLVQELDSAARDDQLRAIERLGAIIYHTPDVVDALKQLVGRKRDDAELSQAAETVLRKIQAQFRPHPPTPSLKVGEGESP